MSLQKIWNDERGGWDWVDLSYALGKTDKPDPRDGQPADEDPPVSIETH